MVLDQKKLGVILEEPILLAIILGPLLLLVFNLFFSFHNKSKSSKPKKSMINQSIKKESSKVVDSVDCGEIEKLAEFKDGKLVMCRCWKSKNFPYCDGSHNNHNKENEDNVGPLLIKK